MTAELTTQPRPPARTPDGAARITGTDSSSLPRRSGIVLTDSALVLSCLLVGLVLLGALMEGVTDVAWWVLLDGLLGLLATLCLPLRRYRPFAVALGLAAATLLRPSPSPLRWWRCSGSSGGALGDARCLLLVCCSSPRSAAPSCIPARSWPGGKTA